jgi:hypothetical protein
LVPSSTRERVWAHCRSAIDNLVVLSPSEIPSHLKLEVLGIIGPEILDILPPQFEESPETMTELLQRKPR